MNVELLERVKALIIAEPKKLNMRYWKAKSSDCGTACCIAGWACAIENQIQERDWDTQDVAQGLLGLDKPSANRLFLVDRWPEKFVTDSYLQSWSDITAEQAVARIDHFIATEGRD